MNRDARYDVLFEPVKIGPVTAKNRFYQAPHCNGMGRTFPSSMAAMRGVKAEGGWAVISTEQVEIHPTSDFTPATECRIWSDQDIRYLARMCDAVHEHDALASIELCHNGMRTANNYSREIPLSPCHIPASYHNHPLQARMMTKSDIRDFRKWHLDAVKRAKNSRLRYYLLLRRAQFDASGQFHVAPLQPANRRIWRLPGKSGSVVSRNY
jgi:dimethylamine/trimethylamine dehydrogenase